MTPDIDVLIYKMIFGTFSTRPETLAAAFLPIRPLQKILRKEENI